ncbi:hypothetical protein PsorP6_015148 [Peronosclerospora sorghi]|uniref:Uncharacterized protein n=1 Tax=Peronosclerospora sorghi TaxID=230839 RepID=A0ACC0VSX3_9STRA|nr:hypothetical protein PsorP6_015148 [Peronosclerospora sorghi]
MVLTYNNGVWFDIEVFRSIFDVKSRKKTDPLPKHQTGKLDLHLLFGLFALSDLVSFAFDFGDDDVVLLLSFSVDLTSASSLDNFVDSLIFRRGHGRNHSYSRRTRLAWRLQGGDDDASGFCRRGGGYGYDYKSYGDDYSNDYYGYNYGNGYYGYGKDSGKGYGKGYDKSYGYGSYYPDYYSSYGGDFGYGYGYPDYYYSSYGYGYPDYYPSYGYGYNNGYPGYDYGYGYPNYFGYESASSAGVGADNIKESTKLSKEDADVKSTEKESSKTTSSSPKSKAKETKSDNANKPKSK